MLLDSDFLINSANRKNWLITQMLNIGYKCIFSSPSIIEVSLGEIGKIKPEQLELSKIIYDTAFKKNITIQNIDNFFKKNTIGFFNPSQNEWLAAKMSLIYYISETKRNNKNYMEENYQKKTV